MDWINALKTDENEALKKLYTLFKKDACNWLQKEFNCSLDESLDVFQTAVIILYDNVVTGKLQQLSSDIKTYLFGIARNKALELVRQKQKEMNYQHQNRWVSYVSENEPDANMEENIRNASQCLLHMGDPCKSLLQLYYFHEKSMEEITSILGYKNTDTTKNQKYKCLKRLQSIIFKHSLKTGIH
ncbi:MAG: sigma-70 family RNA polymerase sigma factor [Saprospiraceae bacterium]